MAGDGGGSGGGSMDVVDAGTLSYEDFCERYMARNRPVLLRNVVTHWFPKALQWKASTPDASGGHQINYAHLREHYGDAVVPVVDGDVVEYGAEARCTMPFAEYLDMLENGTAGKRYLKDWHFVHAFGHDIYTTPPFFKDDWLNWWWDHKESSKDDYRFVYIGPAGSWTPLHHDVFRSYSWSVNVCGRKEWVFFHPDEEPKLKDKFGRYAVPDVTAQDVDEDKFPHFHEAKPVHVIQEAGDAIFVPSGWYHQVTNLEDTISINHNWFNGYNLHELWAFFQREYAAVEHELNDLKELGLVGREFLDQCQLVMRANTGINYVEFRELLYAKASDFLAHLALGDEKGAAAQQHDLLVHLRTIRDVLAELNNVLQFEDGTEQGTAESAKDEWQAIDLQLQALA